MLIKIFVTLFLGLASCAQFQGVLNDFESLLESRNTSLREFDACLSRIPRDQENFFGHAALKAIEQNVIPALELLLMEYIANPDFLMGKSLNHAGYESSNTLAYKAAFCNNVPALRLLQKYGADFNLNVSAETPIFPAIREANIEAVEFLLSAGANVAELGRYKSGIICEALPRVFGSYIPGVDEKNLRLFHIIRILVENGADINFIDRTFNFPLLHACGLPIECVKAVVELGADVNQVNERGEYPLLVAIWRNNVAAAEYLVERGARVDMVFENDKTLLTHAVTRVHFPAFKWLVSLGAVKNVNTYDSPLPIIEAVKYQRLEVLRYLVEELHEPVDVKTVDGESLLTVALNAGFKNITKYVLEVMQKAGVSIDPKELQKAQHIIKYA